MRPAVRSAVIAKPFEPVTILVFGATAHICLIPTTWFGGRLSAPPGLAERLRTSGTELEPDERDEPLPDEPLLECKQLFLRDLARHPQLPAEVTNLFLAEIATLGSVVEVSDGRKARRERQFGSAAEADRYHYLRNAIILGHWRLCLHWVREGNWPQRCLSMTEEDLFGEAILGLDRAIELFEPAHGTALATYAFQWIRQAVGRSRSFTDRLIRLPAHCRNGRSLHPTEYRRLTQIIYFSDPNAPDLESLPDPRSPDPVHAVSNAETDRSCGARLRIAFQEITERQADILRRRFGLGGLPPETLQAIASRYDLTRERVRQIEAAAITTLASGTVRKLLEAVAPE
ncbi:sigma-70 family RNA polymerase sigma factor [Gemmata sp. JC673]|uniref:Sigma-70 family RNA polymerase sigma factor n=1 Tax=Gemmata algarum TaxID=2975278 RepID=A0ABU5ETK4_9BACT|nr:sigma-70 family RNA polymerase sigma factor [Gemmata algarum]MDY3558289.1 sigma-70 family RNA polymerase sigma factor [Gemmata algarum]